MAGNGHSLRFGRTTEVGGMRSFAALGANDRIAGQGGPHHQCHSQFSCTLPEPSLATQSSASEPEHGIERRHQ